MIKWPGKQRKILTTSKTIKLAKRLSKCPEVVRLNRQEEWALAYCFDGVEDSSRDFLKDHLPMLLKPGLPDEELFDLLLVEICEDLRHILYHVRNPKFYTYLHDEKRAERSATGRSPKTSTVRERTSKAGLLKDGRGREFLAKRLAQLPKVTQYDTGEREEADTMVDTFAGLEDSFRILLESHFPKLTKHGLRPHETHHLLLEIGEEFRHIVQRIKESKFYWYLLEPLDQEWTQASMRSGQPPERS